VKLRYLATTAATSTLQVRRGRKLVARVRGAATEGRNTIRWSGKVRGKRAAAGRYKLTLRAVSADGQTATETASLRLRRR
jgi:hypothetical protein